MAILTPEPTSVYRYYDRSNLLLYVGITSRGASRNREHNTSKDWWQYVVRQEVEHYPHRLAAMEREKHLIRRFRPPFNTQHNPDHRETRALYEATAGMEIKPTPQEARKVLAEVQHKLPLIRIDSGGIEALFTCRPEHNALATSLRWQQRVLLRAPRKVGILTAFEASESSSVFVFRGEQKRIPSLENVRLHLKARSHKPLMVDIHEATGVAA